MLVGARLSATAGRRLPDSSGYPWWFLVFFLESAWYLSLETVFLGISALVKADVVVPWV